MSRLSAARRERGHPRVRTRAPGAPLAAAAAAIALCGCAGGPSWFPCSARSSDDVVQAIAYPGPVLPREQVATIYAFDGGAGADAGWICVVDGRGRRASPSTARPSST